MVVDNSQRKKLWSIPIHIGHKNGILVGGWFTPLKNMKVNWDDEIPHIWENKTWQPNHQPELYLLY